MFQNPYPVTQPMPEPGALITREGYLNIEKEIKELWEVERPRISDEVKNAAAQGDLSENADYHYNK